MAEPPRSANEVLAQFDRVDANLTRLEKLWAEISRMTPEGIQWGSSLDRDGYDDALRAFVQIAKALPATDGFRVAEYPLELDSIAQCRIDALEIGEFDAQVAVERSIEAPGRDLAEYRFRFMAKRRELVRQLVGDFTATEN